MAFSTYFNWTQHGVLRKKCPTKATSRTKCGCDTRTTSSPHPRRSVNHHHFVRLNGVRSFKLWRRPRCVRRRRKMRVRRNGQELTQTYHRACDKTLQVRNWPIRPQPRTFIRRRRARSMRRNCRSAYLVFFFVFASFLFNRLSG